ncbi:MFS transporter [Subtercola boreus]|uniref:MFS transporter n=2 Tax=Subtercola boreus TaxID=120213 RepID=A0A3E0WGN1_9MICO|nr:MFS transporter [Subtercola boreus]RFA23278.1 MFS transporter [Subtercola boreus]RFA29086.1 MFS transporter [Subtercola boreus]
MLALILLSAFEALAVTTVMPTISAEFDGGSLYALAFSGPLAVGIVGMVTAGNWSDRSGPRRPLFTSVALFAGGLLVAGLSTNMELLVLGRLVSGLGGGGLTVALFVLVARVFPERLHPKVFAAFAAAWVVPSLVGPLVAGIVAQTVGWRWVFLGVVVLVVFAMVMVVPVMRGFTSRETGEPWKISRIAWSVVAATAVLAASLSGQVAERASTTVVWMLAVGAIVIAVVALCTLLPAGALLARAGLPTIILLRGLVSGSYFAAETYLPYFFTSQYALSPALAGLALSIAGLSWAGASWLQGRYSARISDVASIRIGIGLVLVALAVVLACSLFALPAVLAIVGWLIAGAGMGAMYPRLSVAMLRLSNASNQGFNSSALAISDSIGAASALALTAAIFSTAGNVTAFSFTECFLLAAVLSLVAFAVSGRARS